MTNLKRIRIERGLTQAALASLTGINLRTLQDYEQGAKPINTAAAMTGYSLAKALNVPIEDLFEP